MTKNIKINVNAKEVHKSNEDLDKQKENEDMINKIEIYISPKETEDSSETDGEENVDVYRSAKIALPTMIDEYTKERERAGIIDNKAISIITILLALVTVYMPIIPFEKIGRIYVDGIKSQIIIMIIAMIIFTTALVIVGILFYMLINIVKLRIYKRVDIEEIVDTDVLKEDEHIYEKSLCHHYKDLILQNSKSNDNKSKKLNLCYILTIIVFILLLLSYFLIKII